MAFKYSKNLKTFLQVFGTLAQAMEHGKIVVYSGTPPMAPTAGDSPASRALGASNHIVCTYTTNFAAHTAAVAPKGRFTFTGTTFRVTSVRIAGQECLESPVERVAGETLDTGLLRLAQAMMEGNTRGIPFLAYVENQYVVVSLFPCHTGVVALAPISIGVTYSSDGTLLREHIGAYVAGQASVNGIYYENSAGYTNVATNVGAVSGLITYSQLAPTFFRMYSSGFLSQYFFPQELVIQGVVSSGPGGDLSAPGGDRLAGYVSTASAGSIILKTIGAW